MKNKIILFVTMTICSLSSAKDIAPKEPPIVPTVGQVIDRSRPEFVPQFLSPAGPSRLQQERDWATQNTYPPVCVGLLIPIRPGCYGFVSNHGFWR